MGTFVKAKILNVYDQDGCFLVTAELGGDVRVQFSTATLTDSELLMHLKAQWAMIDGHRKRRVEEISKKGLVMSKEFEI